jgi:uncharacterized membrane protein
MSIVHLHLLLNHVPVIGAVLAVVLLAVTLARRSDELAKVTFGLLGLIGAISIAVFLSGEPAEELVENLPGFSDTIMERHEAMALVATIAVGALGGLALLALGLFRRRTLPRWTVTAGLFAAVAVAGLMGYTANLGGQIRHTEIRPGAVASVSGADATSEEAREHRDRR